MALNITVLVEETKKYKAANSGVSWFVAALRVSGNENLARDICRALGRRGGKKAARLRKEKQIQKKLIIEKKYGKQKEFDF